MAETRASRGPPSGRSTWALSCVPLLSSPSAKPFTHRTSHRQPPVFPSPRWLRSLKSSVPARPGLQGRHIRRVPAHPFLGALLGRARRKTQLQDADASIFRLYHPDVVSLMGKDRKVISGDSVIVGAKSRHGRPQSNLHEWRLAQAAVLEAQWGHIKLMMITPAWFHMRYKLGKAYDETAYSSAAEYFKDVAKVYQKGLEVVYEAKPKIVQLDDPGLACFCSEQFRKGWEEDTDNISIVDELLDAYIALYNDCISKTNMRTGVHPRRGSFIGEKHFGYRLNVIVGIISTKLPARGDKDKVKRRIYQPADFVAEGSGQTREEGLQRMGEFPRCGFSTHEEGYPLSEKDQRKKLALARQVADEIWEEP